ncbi:hypothetical protein B566_EDAN009635 [Ephemera danica]|nr:hypothetical protein B566_EDAN009635 [Ephemera danica]
MTPVNEITPTTLNMNADVIIDLTADDSESDEECMNYETSHNATESGGRHEKTTVTSGSRVVQASTSMELHNSRSSLTQSNKNGIGSFSDEDETDNLQNQHLFEYGFGDFNDWSEANAESSVDMKQGSPDPHDNNDIDSENDFDMPSSQTSFRSYHPLSDSEPDESTALSSKNEKKQKKKSTTEHQKLTDNLAEPAKGKGRNRRTPEEREAEEVAKQRKKREREEVRRMAPKYCKQYISLDADSSLVAIPALQGLFHNEPLLKYKHQIVDHIPYSVKWVRELLPGPQDEPHLEHCKQLVQVLEMDIVKELVISNSLTSHIESLLTNVPDGTRIAILVLGSQQYFAAHSSKKKKKTTDSESPEIEKSQFDEAIACCNIDLGVTIRLVETSQDVNEWLARYSKALAEHPFKMQKKDWQLQCRFHLASEKGKNIRIGSSALDGLPQLWLNVLRKFKRVNLDLCKAIAAAYEACSSESEAQKLIQNIQIQQVNGPLAVQRRVGPVISRKLHTFFTSMQPEKTLA